MILDGLTSMYIIVRVTTYIVQYIFKKMKLMVMKGVAFKQIGAIGICTHTHTRTHTHTHTHTIGSF